MKVTGIVLAGGKSSRIGSDKGLIEFNGKKLIEYPLDLLGKFCSELIISSENPSYRQFGFTLVGDEVQGTGPLSGICSALSFSSGEQNIIVGCDMPFLTEELIERLLENSGKGVVPVHRGFFEPLAAVYHTSLADFFKQCLREGSYSLKDILPLSGVTFLSVEDLLQKYPLLFFNINSPGDLQKCNCIT